MNIKIDKNTSKEQFDKILQKISSENRPQILSNNERDWSKYCGVISLKKSPLQIQKKLRDEWSR